MDRQRGTSNEEGTIVIEHNGFDTQLADEDNEGNVSEG